MKALEAMAEILKREGVEYLFCYPTTDLIDAVAAVGIRPIVCRQERVGLGMADGLSRVSNGSNIGVFAMQAGPGAENAFAGVTTAYADSSPLLVLPSGYPREREGWPRYFTAERGYRNVTKWLETINVPEQTEDAMRRAFSRLRNGRPGPVMVELPADVAELDVGETGYEPATSTRSLADPRDVERAARALANANAPVILAGQGVLWAGATDEVVELAEMLGAPTAATLLGKSAFPETHALSIGTAATSTTPMVRGFLDKADVILAVGASLAKHQMNLPLPEGRTIIQLTNDEADLNRNYAAAHPLLADAKLGMRQLIDAVRDAGGTNASRRSAVEAEVASAYSAWVNMWRGKLESQDAPINPYRVVWGAEPRHPGGRGHRNPRLRQPARPDGPVLPVGRSAQLHRLGKVPCARHGPRLRDGRQARRTRQGLHQLDGRCRIRHDGPRLRDRCAQRHSDHHDSVEQLDDGHRDQAARRLPREVRYAGCWRQLRRPGPLLGRLGGARRGPGGSWPRNPARPARHRGGPGGAAGVHHVG